MFLTFWTLLDYYCILALAVSSDYSSLVFLNATVLQLLDFWTLLAFGFLGRDFLDAPGRFLFDALFGLPLRYCGFPSLSRYRHAAKVLWLQ